MALLLSLGLWGAIWLLAEDGARPIIFYNRFADCWQPQVKGWTMMVNSIINNWRRKTSDSTGNLGARPSCRPGCMRGDWAGDRSAPDRFLGFGSATNLTGKSNPLSPRTAGSNPAPSSGEFANLNADLAQRSVFRRRHVSGGCIGWSTRAISKAIGLCCPES